MYELISSTMPDGEPGSLDAQEYVDVVAYLLRVNNYPTGETELPADRTVLDGVRIEPASS
jgi:hypothetical protein